MDTQRLEEQLSAQGKILLAILRDSMQQGIPISRPLQNILEKHMGIAEADWKIIADCLEVDVRRMLENWKR